MEEKTEGYIESGGGGGLSFDVKKVFDVAPQSKLLVEKGFLQGWKGRTRDLSLSKDRYGHDQVLLACL